MGINGGLFNLIIFISIPKTFFMNIHQVSWAFDPSHVIKGINNVLFASPLTQGQLLQVYPYTFTTGINSNGETRLCGAKILDQPMTLTCNDGTNDYNVSPTPFEAVYFINGHPTNVPIFRPK